jgi:kynurenine formamidase
MKTKFLVLLTAIICVLVAGVVYQFILLQHRDVVDTPGRRLNGTMERIVKVTDAKGNTKQFRLGEPKPVSRQVWFEPGTKASNAFHLPLINSKTVEFEGRFIGDVNRGGSCNVDILSYVPHGLTHIETSAHILSLESKPAFVHEIPLQHLSGIVYLIDLTQPLSGPVLGEEPGQQVPWQAIEEKLRQNTLPISMLAIKTKSSLLPQDYDFSGKDFLSISAEAAKGIHDYKYRVNCLLLDLPSIDPEADEGKLLAHRNYFGLPMSGHSGEDLEKRALVELAWFAELEEGYYYADITPPRFRTNAVTTGIVFRLLEEIAK